MTDDLISRQAAIDALGERPIVWTDDDQYTLGERNQYDIDRLTIETLPSAQQKGDNVPKFFEWLGKQPTIDAVEVVRCRDCRWYEIYQLKQDGTDDRRYNPSYCTLLRHRFKPDWYCADGERKEGEEG